MRALGAEAIVLDLLDVRAVSAAVATAKPDAIIHEATALATHWDFRHFDRTFAQTNRLRAAGTDALIAAARKTGVDHLVAQSYAMAYARQGVPIKTEADPLDPTPAPVMRDTYAALRHLEGAVISAGGIALRYGAFYGSPDDVQLEFVRKGQFPLVSDGAGMWSFVHLEDAAAATTLALERGQSGIYNIVDDEPAPVREWLPALAAAIGARPPRHVPRWLARLFSGEAGVVLMTECRGAANGKAKRELGWTLQHPSWRQGFVKSYSAPSKLW